MSVDLRLGMFLIAGLAWLAGPARAEAPAAEEKKLDLTLRRPGDPDSWLRLNFRIDSAWFAGFHPWAGNAEQAIGGDSYGWGEIGVVPALDGQLSLGGYGTLSGRLSGVFTTTQIDLDWAGSNFIAGETRYPAEITLEDFYVRWTSGELVPSLGEDAIELSFGSQPYQVGTGFLFYHGGVDGGERGGFWLGLRKAFQLAGIARVRKEAFSAEAVYFRADEGDDVFTQGAGVNFDYDFGEMLNLERANLGVGYWNLFDSDDARRDGLDVINVRADLQPLRSLPGLQLAGEMVKEENGAQNDSWGAYGEIGYEFTDCPWTPYASYRLAYFSGDDGTGDNGAFDALYWGFQDWNYWYLGEISGEWITSNRNLRASVVRLRASPLEALTAQVFWIYQRLDQLEPEIVPRPPTDPRVALITDRDLSHEVDFVVDWTVNDYLSTSFVAAFLVPLKGGEQALGADGTWGQFMISTSIRF